MLDRARLRGCVPGIFMGRRTSTMAHVKMWSFLTALNVFSKADMESYNSPCVNGGNTDPL